MDDTDLRDERPARRGDAATAVTTGGHRERRRYERGAL
jgi:hypothetical protein